MRGTCSPLSEISIPPGCTPSLHEKLSPTFCQTPGYRSDGWRSPAGYALRPPPPIVSMGLWASNTERDSPATPGLNTAIPSSPSPLAETRFGMMAPVCAQWHPTASPTCARRQSILHVPTTSEVKPVPQRQFSGENFPIVEERDPETKRVISRYRCGAFLGSGGFAKVYEFEDLSTGSRYAAKVIEKMNLTRRGSSSKFRMEVDLHSRMNHPNIVRFIKSFQDEFFYYIILERCSPKSLMSLSRERGAFDCHEIQYIMRQIVSAVEYMHSNLIIHRDLKLGNVMIDLAGNMKVGDFGFASELTSPLDRKTTVCGTPNYIAPEVLACETSSAGYGLEADIWSLGVLLYALAIGKPPFETKDIKTTQCRIMAVDYAFPKEVPIPETCKDLIRWMLQKNPQRRPSPVQVLAHSFLCLPAPARTVPKSLIPPHMFWCLSQNERRSPAPLSPPPVQTPTDHSDKEANADNVTPPVSKQRVPTAEIGSRKMTMWCPKEADLRSEITALVTGVPQATDGATPLKPTAPAAMVQSGVFCSKYGYGFLTFQKGLQFPEVFLNDKTKLIYNRDEDTVLYYGRSKISTTTIDSGKRSPILSEDLAKRGFCDELVVFRNASDTLARRSEHKDNQNQVEAAAAKKLAIAKFFLPFLERGTKDRRMAVLNCAFHSCSSSLWENLFAAKDITEGNSQIVYVKDAVIGSLQEITGEHHEVDMMVLAVRLSDYSFQVSFRCDAAAQSLYRPRYDNDDINGTSHQSWAFDVLVYSGFRALMAFESRDTVFALSFGDLRCDGKTVSDGKTYFAAGFTNQVTRITVPPLTLRAIVAVLRKIRCCTDILQCF
uniref:Putative serine/threonine-protein kinase n=1 Tax=Trypanosoma congolense (strain IL3000) TaxID=1068625 RepID=G0UP87_TRYCI|nr:putative serine/threonine-protein kinase [Trypanosoma congolense IL3000]